MVPVCELCGRTVIEHVHFAERPDLMPPCAFCDCPQQEVNSRPADADEGRKGVMFHVI